MKWLKRVTEITAYVSQCAHAIAEAANVLADKWPTNSPFGSNGVVPPKEK